MTGQHFRCLREQGYRTVALHNFYRNYYSRAAVYPLFGFDRFIALDEIAPVDFNGKRPEGMANNRGIAMQKGIEALIDGPFPSDDSLVWRLMAKRSVVCAMGGTWTLHMVLDTTFREDACRVQKGHVSQNLSRTPKRSLRSRRKTADRLPDDRASALGLLALG